MRGFSPFTIDLSHADLTGSVNGNPKARVPLLRLDLAHAKLTAGTHVITAMGSASSSPRSRPGPSTPRWEPGCPPPGSTWAPYGRCCESSAAPRPDRGWLAQRHTSSRGVGQPSVRTVAPQSPSACRISTARKP
jgi:hypothetical protein